MAMHHNRVTWREGMFLRPQHFQQQQRTGTINCRIVCVA